MIGIQRSCVLLFFAWCLTSPTVNSAYAQGTRTVARHRSPHGQFAFKFLAPFRIEDGQILIEGKVNQKPCRFGIDTGALASQIDESFARELNLSAGKSANDISPSTSTIAKEVEIDKLKIENFEMDLASKLPDHTIMLGFEVLRQNTITLNFEDDTIEFSQRPVDGHGSLPMLTGTDGRAYTCLFVGNYPCSFVIDLGTPANLISEKQFRDILENAPSLKDSIKELHTRSSFMRASGEMLRASYWMIPMKQKNFEFEVAVGVKNSKSGSPALLGSNFFRQFEFVTFDFPRNRLLLGRKLSPDEL